MPSTDTVTLINEQTGDLAFKMFSFQDNGYFDHIQRLNYFSLVWVKSGHGKMKVDFFEYDFSEQQLFALTPYQPFMFQPEDGIEGVVINFHPDFFCIHKHHEEVACNGVLFNNIFCPPFVRIDDASRATLDLLLDQMHQEAGKSGIAQFELLVSYLKIFLITTARLKREQQSQQDAQVPQTDEPAILQKLKDAIEIHFKVKHSAGEYADLLHITPKALARITKSHFNKTLTQLIAERIVIEAKRDLYLTDYSVKEIAYSLGYDDEYYFSRFFKKHTGVSPKGYRDTVGFSMAM